MRQVQPVSVYHLPPRMPPFTPRELFAVRSERFARCCTMIRKACAVDSDCDLAIDSDWNLNEKIDVRQLLD